MRVDIELAATPCDTGVDFRMTGQFSYLTSAAAAACRADRYEPWLLPRYVSPLSETNNR